jgi:diadenylate cyclase
MPIRNFISGDSVLLLESSTRDGAFLELANALAKKVPGFSAEEILSRVLIREESFSTRISDHIAIPHAVEKTMDRTVAILGISAEGIPYDARSDKGVHIIVMMLGSEHDHLDALQQIVLVLQDDEIVRRLIESRDPASAYELLLGPEPEVTETAPTTEMHLTEITLRHATLLARQTEASKIVIYIDETIDLDQYRTITARMSRPIVIQIGTRGTVIRGVDEHRIVLPFSELTRSSKVELGILYLLSQGTIGRSDRIVNVFGQSGSGVLDTLMLTDIGREFGLFFTMSLGDAPEGLEPQVFTRVLQLAHTLAIEGREGKPIGTLFVVGDYETVRSHCQQLIINPFRGYSEDERNILDPSLEETIKEYSRIDGAFVIRGDGVVTSAGTYIRSGNVPPDLIAGLGARHAAAAAITAVTNAVSIAVSESTRKVSIFRAGRRFMQF